MSIRVVSWSKVPDVGGEGCFIERSVATTSTIAFCTRECTLRYMRIAPEIAQSALWEMTFESPTLAA